jgi:hypothetical protein
MLFSITLLVVSMALGARYGMVMVGLHKGPILATFEKYGDDEPMYYPLPHILLWPGLIAFAASNVLQTTLPISVTFAPIGIVMVLCAVLSYYYRTRLQHYWATLPAFPEWHGRFMKTTVRGERRRIAYMWLRLPVRTRLLYNANDRLFFVWAEQVIVSTVN